MGETPNRFAGGCKVDKQKSPTSTQSNRFAGGCTYTGTTSTKKQTPEITQYVTDVHWYPEKRTLVIEKNNHKNLVVNLSELIPEEPKVDEDIKVLVWNPVTNKYNNVKVANKGDEYTDALQKIVVTLSSPASPVFNNNVIKIAQQVIDRNFVWDDWSNEPPVDEEPQG